MGRVELGGPARLEGLVHPQPPGSDMPNLFLEYRHVGSCDVCPEHLHEYRYDPHPVIFLIGQEDSTEGEKGGER